jgi:hypothetical protein
MIEGTSFGRKKVWLKKEFQNCYESFVNIPNFNSILAMRIRIGFSANPRPAFYLKADPDAESQTNANPDLGQTLPSQKVEFEVGKYTLCTRR